ncbi:hypothetical protein IscW_ISCW012612 [Ixodes scapularis]|uniref:Uncharacterized protein n=1 Tax=Ixodes scapularis TaxID=6945 RepID=B7QEW3_IXOSC|nr:hypothetical protein IscW_ISCW012612 [Ixodes scapularis]|eukprot:XP_002414077.1 hypothetical protein IscW_ISCW012612 [Ixodes scapularis]
MSTSDLFLNTLFAPGGVLKVRLVSLLSTTRLYPDEPEASACVGRSSSSGT